MGEDSAIFWSFDVPSYPEEYPDEESVDEIDVHAEPWLKTYLAVTIIACITGLPLNFAILFIIMKKKLYRDVIWFLQGVFSITLIVRIIMIPIEYHASRHPRGFAYETVASCKAFHFFVEFSGASSNMMLLALLSVRLISFTPRRQYIAKHPIICGVFVSMVVMFIAFFSTVPIVSYLDLTIFDDERIMRICHVHFDKYDPYLRWNKFNVSFCMFMPFIIGVICVIIMAINQTKFYREYCKTSVSYLRQLDSVDNKENGSTKASDFEDDRPMVDEIYSGESEQEERRITILHIAYMVIYMVILLPYVISVTMAVHYANAYTSVLHWALKYTHIVSLTVGIINPLAAFFIIPKLRELKS
ncbi:uncharacterized protein [Antedon mediterranea]|uniref:uncharacterized protein n=1 Tax=Antedon mediterranea TaxID=105859 RepID=UPI003AF427CF